MFYREYKRENTLFTMMPFVEIFISQKFKNRGMTQSFVRNTNDAIYYMIGGKCLECIRLYRWIFGFSKYLISSS